jgi:hypothetical protein
MNDVTFTAEARPRCPKCNKVMLTGMADVRGNWLSALSKSALWFEQPHTEVPVLRRGEVVTAYGCPNCFGLFLELK